MRAMHHLYDEPRLLEDPVVLKLLDARDVAAITSNPTPFDTPTLRRLRAGIALRSRYAEDCVADAVGHGVRQYVILGAGLDSFAYRNPFPASALRVFEVDHPATQAWKRERLAAAGIDVSASPTFVPVDFERETLAAALATHGFDAAAPAIVSWLGVIMYLTRDAVRQTFAWAASLAPGSTIVFTYLAEPSGADRATRVAFDGLAAHAASQGEPWITSFEPSDLARELTGVGLALVEDLGSTESIARYFRGRTDGLRPGSSGHLARATVPAR
jgi:methyltransferase (TIGR00027 family)